MDKDHTIVKPRLFVSHASSDGDFATAVMQEIEKVFANGLEVFCTSSPGAIGAGKDWLSTIEERLDTSKAVIAIITPVSIERPWLWFEVGATWTKGRSGDCRIYPLCAPEIDLSQLPSPLDRLQALSMGKAQDLKMLFQALIDQFGFGSISTFRATNISKRIPKYKDVKVQEIDLNEKAFYSGKYTGYNAEELMEVIDDNFFRPESYKIYSDLYNDPEKYIHTGKLIHFRFVDSQLELPPGTSKKLLSQVAERYGLVVKLETDNLIRYQLTEDVNE